MAERYKVLGAMLALGEFTVPELAQYSGVRPQTVRTVVTRERHNLKPLAIEARSGRGGRFKRFQLKPEQVETIRQELNDLYRALPPERPAQVQDRSADSEPVPLAILAAEDTLIRRFPTAGAQNECKRLLNLAEGVWQHYCSAPAADTLPSATRLHLEALDGLRKLCAAELATAYEPFFSRLAFDRAKESLRLVAARFREAGQAEQAAELLDRALASAVPSPATEIVLSKAAEMPSALGHPEVYVREVTIEAMAAAASATNVATQMASHLVKRLRQDSDPVVRRSAAEVLGELKLRDAAVEEALSQAANEDEPSVQVAARKSLAALEIIGAEESTDAASSQAFETA